MKKSIMLILCLLMTTLTMATEINSKADVLELDEDDRVEFETLPLEVQNLMVNEAKFSKQVKKFNEQKMSHRDRRDKHHDDTYRCVARCTWRRSDGSCASYGQDYCGYGAKCSPKCTWRRRDGTCANFDRDYCGEGASCSPNCTWRRSDGSCAGYDADNCF